ncbi:uncharacterized protein LOC144922718 [Branchiostoma floridae x Branchiostoma belcheri]
MDSETARKNQERAIHNPDSANFDTALTPKALQVTRTATFHIQNAENVYCQNGSINNMMMEKQDEERQPVDQEGSQEPLQGQEGPPVKLTQVTLRMLSMLALCKPEVPLPVRVLLLIEKCAVNGVRHRVVSKGMHRSEIKDILNLSCDPFDDSNSNEMFCISQGKCDEYSLSCSPQAYHYPVSDMEEVFRNCFCVEDDKDWDLLKKLLPHLDNWYSHAEKCGVERELPIGFLRACLHAFGKFRCDGWGKRAKMLADKCIRYCENSGSDEVDEKERTHREIGEYYRKLGKYELSEKHLNAALEIGKAKSDLTLQITRMYLARCKVDKGEYREAESLIDGCLSSPDVKSLEEKTERPYLRGRMYFEKARCSNRLHKYTEAYDFCSKAVTVSGSDSFRYPQYAMYCAFILVQRELKTDNPNEAVLNEALGKCERAKTIMKDRHGDNHHQMAQLLCIEVKIWLSKKDPEIALLKAKDALSITKRKYGPDHNNVAKVYDLLGDIHCQKGNMQKANKAYKMAIFIYGEEHSHSEDIKGKCEKLKESQGNSFDPNECDRTEIDKELVK